MESISDFSRARTGSRSVSFFITIPISAGSISGARKLGAEDLEGLP